MIALFEARGYKSLRHVTVHLQPFQMLIGPNASGKSNVLEALSFLSDALRHHLDHAITLRGSSLRDLTFQRKGNGFELAWVFKIPSYVRKKHNLPYAYLRYALAVGMDADGVRSVRAEHLYGLSEASFRRSQWSRRKSLLKTDRGWRRLLRRKGERAYFYGETSSWTMPFDLPNDQLALQNVPEDVRKFPSLVWMRSLARRGLHMVHLQPDVLRTPSRPDAPPVMGRRGEHFHVLVKRLLQSDRAVEWKHHLQTLLPDLEAVEVKPREVDNYLFTRLQFRGRKEFPAWLLSDGTLRFLALTALAFYPEKEGIFLIEEPENGVHPRVIQHLYDALSSVYDGQVLVTTHSPFFLQYARPEEILLVRLHEGETQILEGKELPILQRWKNNLADLMVSGLLDLQELARS